MLCRTRMMMVATVGTVLIVTTTVGCSKDRPADYAKQRPGIDQLDPRDRGLQSKDVVDATDVLAADLLAAPELNAAKDRWTLVVTGVKNETTDPRFNYDIFTERLRVNLSRHGRGRIALIENRERLRDLQSRELEQERDDFGQGPGAGQPGPAGIQPDYALYGRIMEMPNRGTSYYFAEFTITDMRTREQVWTNAYEVRVAR